MSIVKRGNQVEPQAKPLAAVAIRPAQEAKAFEPVDDVFGHQPLTRQLLIVLLLLCSEPMMFALFMRRARVLMLFLDARVTTVAQTLGLVMKRQVAALEQSEIMRFAFAESRRHNTFA